MRALIRRVDYTLAVAFYAAYFICRHPCQAARNVMHSIRTGKPRG